MWFLWQQQGDRMARLLVRRKRANSRSAVRVGIIVPTIYNVYQGRRSGKPDQRGPEADG
jgi:hypothetical protein